MALPLQMLIAGPMARFLFRKIFLKKDKNTTTNEIQNCDEKILRKTI